MSQWGARHQKKRLFPRYFRGRVFYPRSVLPSNYKGKKGGEFCVAERGSLVPSKKFQHKNNWEKGRNSGGGEQPIALKKANFARHLQYSLEAPISFCRRFSALMERKTAPTTTYIKENPKDNAKG